MDYEIDLTQPEGQRIRNLTWRDKPLDPDQKLRIAINSYRSGGAAGYGMFRNAKVVWRSPEDVRQLIIDYYSEHRELPAKPVGNWRVVPNEALQTLERDALKEAPLYK